MSKTYTRNGIQYNINYSDKYSIQWLRHIGDGKFKHGGTMDLHDEGLSLSTLIRLAENNSLPKKGDVVNIFHPDKVTIYGLEPTMKGEPINFLTMEFSK